MGYMVCYNCGGYYELRPDETPFDYKRCQCGSKLTYVPLIKEACYNHDQKVGVWHKRIKPRGYKNRPGELEKENKRLLVIMEELKKYT
ncbi:MAG TPA: hypothetical protein VK444_03715 [Methanobacteriaceae archaeon]|nr:hypothetical protein [Methanobacteriaceae archaeon]